VQEIRLPELSRRACERLVRDVLGEQVADEMVTRLWERSAGNAFFLEELLRATVERRGGELPETMLALIESRLDGLDAEARRLLRAASVYGEVFWRGGVEVLLGSAQAITTGTSASGPCARPVDDPLDQLERAEWIVGRPAAKLRDEKEYAFRHAVVREAVYGTLTAEDRTLGHRLAGAWLEAAGEADALVMAERYQRGGDAMGAIRWYCAAVEQALGGNDLAAVIARVDGALALGPSGEALGRLALARAIAHEWRQEGTEADVWAERAAAAFPAGSAPWCTAMQGMLRTAGRRGDGARFKHLIEDLLASEGRTKAPDMYAHALGLAAIWLGLAGRRQASQALLGEAEQVVARLQEEPAAEGAVLAGRAIFAAMDDDLPGFRDLNIASIARLEVAGDYRRACQQRSLLAHANSRLGAHEAADLAARTALAEAIRMDVPQAISAAQNVLGVALARRGAFEEACAAFSVAIEGSVAGQNRRQEGDARSGLAEALLHAGDLDGAEVSARHAVSVLDAFGPIQLAARAILAEVLLARGRAGEALEVARVAFEPLESFGHPVERDALVRVVHAEALHANEHHAEARAMIASARGRLLARAARIGEEDLRRSFLEGVPENARTIELAGRWLGGR
jgi:hypothetical protein